MLSFLTKSNPSPEVKNELSLNEKEKNELKAYVDAANTYDSKLNSALGIKRAKEKELHSLHLEIIRLRSLLASTINKVEEIKYRPDQEINNLLAGKDFVTSPRCIINRENQTIEFLFPLTKDIPKVQTLFSSCGISNAGIRISKDSVKQEHIEAAIKLSDRDTFVAGLMKINEMMPITESHLSVIAKH